MATAAKNGEQGTASVRRAILFELDNTAVNGREITYGVIKKALDGRGVDFNEIMFSRHCLNAPLKRTVLGLVGGTGKSRPSEDKLMDAIASGLAEAFTGGTAKVLPGMKALLDTAAKEGLALGALSSLPDEQAQAVGQLTGLTDAGEILSASDGQRLPPTADAWLKLSRLIGVMPSLSVVLTTSSASCKAALSAGMRCVVVPDRFTAFQDFGGARAVVEELNAAAIAEVLAAIKTV